jgi:hypothetical protein
MKHKIDEGNAPRGAITSEGERYPEACQPQM